MTYSTMYDSVDAGKLPDGEAYAAYVNGDYANYSQVRARFPKARVFGIDVIGTGWQNASILDYEPGNPCYTTDRLIEFAVGREDFRPHTTCIYCNRDDLPKVEDTLTETWHVIFLATLDGTRLAGTRTAKDLELWRLLERCEVKPGASEEAGEQAGLVLHQPEPRPDQRGQLADVAFRQIGQGSLEH